MSGPDRSQLDALLDLLAEEVADRLKGRPRPAEPLTAAQPEPEPAPAVAEPELEPEPEMEAEQEPGPPPRGPTHAERVIARLAVGLLILVVLINIPFNRYGVTLATAMPDSASLTVRDGLVVKEADDEEIYVYRGGQFHWISSLLAFEHYGFTWEDVHVVEDGFMDRFEIGSAIHVLLKCRESPHIYRLERGVKRWIVDIPTLEAEGHVWDDVRFVSCSHLRGLPDGETIPASHGPPPTP